MEWVYPVVVDDGCLAASAVDDAGSHSLLTRLFEPAMQAQLNTRNAVAQDLQNAVERHELLLHYQIQVDRDGRPIGAEPLVRWMHPQRGLLLPPQFIATAEQCGLIGDIGKWALQAACEAIRDLSTQPSLQKLRVAVNVSPLQFRDRGFAEGVGTTVFAAGVAPARLKLEITESAIPEDIDDAIQKMPALRALGIDFALDDFGTGSSSLTVLLPSALKPCPTEATARRATCAGRGQHVSLSGHWQLPTPTAAMRQAAVADIASTLATAELPSRSSSKQVPPRLPGRFTTRSSRPLLSRRSPIRQC